MKRYLKKVWPLVSASFLASFTIASANDDYMDMEDLDVRISALEDNKCIDWIGNPSARPEVRDGLSLYISAEFIYWKAVQGGLGFTVKDKKIDTFCSGLSPDTSAVLTNGKLANPDFDWKGGFKLGAGYNLEHDEWDLSVNWIRFHTYNPDDRKIGTNNRDAGCCSESEQLYTVWNNSKIDICNTAGGCSLSSSQFSIAEEAETTWRLNLDVFDAELGREYFVSEWLILRPFASIRNAWIHQVLRIEYENESAAFLGNLSYSKDKFKMKNRYWGMGPRFGINSLWGLGYGLGIYGDFALSLLYGQFRISETETTLENPNGKNLATCSIHPYKVTDHLQQAVSIADLSIGLKWDWMLAHDIFHLGLWAGWEQHLFWDQNQLIRFVDPQHQGVFAYTNGNLTTQGLTTGLRIDF